MQRQLRRAGKPDGNVRPAEAGGQQPRGRREDSHPIAQVSPSADITRLLDLQVKVKDLEAESEELRAAAHGFVRPFAYKPETIVQCTPWFQGPHYLTLSHACQVKR